MHRGEFHLGLSSCLSRTRVQGAAIANFVWGFIECIVVTSILGHHLVMLACKGQLSPICPGLLGSIVSRVQGAATANLFVGLSWG